MKLTGLAAAAITTAAPRRARSQASSSSSGKAASGALAVSHLAYVGCRTTRERNARGDGINVYAIDAKSGAWQHIQLVAGLMNPSFLAFNRAYTRLYVVHGDTSDVSAYSVDPASGRLTHLNTAVTGGKNPAHLVVDPTDRFLLVANHYSSTVAVFPLRDDGVIDPYSDLVTMQGTPGPHVKEQVFARPHQIRFDPSGRFAVVPDKGLDRMFVFRLDTATGKLLPSEVPSVATRETAGPRHVDFHPTLPCAYVVNELDSTVATYRFDSQRGVLTPIQVLSALPSSFTGNSRAAEIEVARSGRFVYASNRGHDSIAIFAVDRSTGELTNAGWAPSRGKTPRYFAIDPAGAAMYVANEESDTIVQFGIDVSQGSLAPTGQVVRTGSPVCILFSPDRRAT